MNKLTSKLRAAADRLQRDLDKPKPYNGMNPTRKRMQAWTQHARDTARTERCQRALRTLANWQESDEWPTWGVHPLEPVKDIIAMPQPYLDDTNGEPPHTTQCSRELFQQALDYMKGLRTADDVRGALGGWRLDHEPVRAVGRWLLLNAAPADAKRERRRRIEQAERELFGMNIPGFFPTPHAVVHQMMKVARIERGMRVLEPSAGSGRIADAIRASGVEPRCCEIQPKLVRLLELKGYARVLEGDFLELCCMSESTGRYDRIVMNPPFEDGQDAEHVMHAYELLAPGGRLVALLSPGPFYRNDRKAREFRKWLDAIIGDEQVDWREGISRGQQDCSFTFADDCELEWSTLPENSFRESGTGAQVRMLLIDKPATPAAAIAAAALVASLPRVAF
jgi:phospholipid N-methyltransferase